MKHFPKILMVVAALLLLTLFLFPMWRITLYAPQYPDGVSLYIWINKIGGETSGTLQNINILNHYVGMKYIEPDDIPELVYFPYVVMGLIALGLAAAFTNNRKVFLGWTLLFVVLSILGIYDFYLWEYDYGHSLSPTAPIKIPGASFQPPLIGIKDILNFQAHSFPHTSGVLAGLSILLGFAAWWLKLKLDRKNEAHTSS